MNAPGGWRGLALHELSGPRKLGIAVATFGSFVASVVALFPRGEPQHPFLLIPVGGLFFAIVAAQLAPLPAQLFARAMQWSNLGLGFVLSVLGSTRERAGGMMLALACGAALLTLGRRGLAEAERRAGYMPAALRSSLLLLMVLALADAQSFALFGFARLESATFGAGLLVAAVALVVGFVLLARLSLFGVVLDAIACALVLLLSVVSPRVGDTDLRLVLGVLSAVHLLVAVPTLVAASRGRAVLEVGPRARAIAATVVVVGLMLGALVGYAAR